MIMIARLFKLKRLTVGVAALVFATFTTSGENVQASDFASSPEADGLYGVVVVDGQQIGEALAQLSVVRPDLKMQIVQTLASGTVIGGASLRQDIQSGRSFHVANPINMSSNSSSINMSTFTSTPIFEGSIVLTGYDCNASGCLPVSKLSHNAIFNLGFTTYQVTGKTSGSRTNWSSIAAFGYCTAGIRQVCSGNGNYPSGATWSQTLLSFSTAMGGKTARILSTFSAAWRGSPASLSGYTPFFSCSSIDQICQFTT